MATRSLLDMPPELLVHILAFLPVHALLKFSQTCRFASSLAQSSLHTLCLGIHPTRVAGIISRLGATQYPQPKQVKTAFLASTSLPDATTVSRDRRDGGIGQPTFVEQPLANTDPYRVSVLIPEASTFDYTLLLGFHTALTKSILDRHGATLRNLDLSLWTLTTPIAKALSNLSALRALSIRIEDLPHVRAVPRSRIATQRLEEDSAWTHLANTATWASRLHALRIEGAELDTSQLITLLRRARWCRELWLCKCPKLDVELWEFLGSEWEGRAALRILGVMRCGQLDERVLDVIGRFAGLQFLSLQGCHGLNSDAVERKNCDEWHIPECITPLVRSNSSNSENLHIEVEPIEVDPLYI